MSKCDEYVLDLIQISYKAIPKGLKVIGTTDQGFPIIGSEDNKCSFYFFIFDFGKDDII